MNELPNAFTDEPLCAMWMGRFGHMNTQIGMRFVMCEREVSFEWMLGCFGEMWAACFFEFDAFCGQDFGQNLAKASKFISL